MKRNLSREKVALAITLVLLMLPIVLGGWYVTQKHRWAQDRLTELEPRHARLLGMEAKGEELKKTATQARELLTHHVYPASQDVSQAGNDAQQRIRNIFTAAGLDIVSSQVLAPKTEKSFDRILLSVRGEGQLLALQSALVGLSSQSPTILIEGFSVQTVGVARANVPQRLGAQFNFSVLRERP